MATVAADDFVKLLWTIDQSGHIWVEQCRKSHTPLTNYGAVLGVVGARRLHLCKSRNLTRAKGIPIVIVNTESAILHLQPSNLATSFKTDSDIEFHTDVKGLTNKSVDKIAGTLLSRFHSCQ
jgi:hypothetical protein